MRTKKLVIAASYLAYISSLLVPAVQYSTGSYKFGWELLIEGFFGLLFGLLTLLKYEFEPLIIVYPWLANPLLLLTLIQVNLELIYKSMVLAFMTVLFMAGFLINPIMLCVDCLLVTELVLPVYGYYLWLISGVIPLLFSLVMLIQKYTGRNA